MKRTGVGRGALLGALLMLPAIAIMFLGSRAAGLPFAPFDVFDWVSRRLPGPLLTFGIDTMVSAIVALNLGEISTAAKTAEKIMAVMGLVVTAAAGGAVLFASAIPRQAPTSSGRFADLTPRGWRAFFGPARTGRTAGAIIGFLTGLPVALASRAVNQSAATGNLSSALWIVIVFAGWGVALGWVHERLSTATQGPPDDPAVERIDRRRFLIRLGGTTAVITVAGAGLGALLRPRVGVATVTGIPWSTSNPLPNAAAAVLSVTGTRPELTPLEDHYRIDINTAPPVIRDDWTLPIEGLVDRPMRLTLADLQNNYPPRHQFVTLACISNPVGGDLTSTTRWTGVSLAQLIEQAGPRPGATHLSIRSADGFHEMIALDAVRADERIMLTYAWDGLPLAIRHGYPLRIYIPDRYGMKQPKWIVHLELVDREEPGYWVRRGWDPVARMNATSVIDTVGVDMMLVLADQRMLIPIGGIAHAGARGISRVQVRVDDGDWQDAQIRDPLSETTWVIWRFDWPYAEGEHTFTVKCFEADDTSQVVARAPIRPSGATGLHSRNEMF